MTRVQLSLGLHDRTASRPCAQVYDQGSSQERVYSNSGKHVVLSILQVGGGGDDRGMGAFWGPGDREGPREEWSSTQHVVLLSFSIEAEAI